MAHFLLDRLDDYVKLLWSYSVKPYSSRKQVEEIMEKKKLEVSNNVSFQMFAFSTPFYHL